MRKILKQAKNTLVNGLLLTGLVGLLMVYLAAIGSDVPTHVYTPRQYEYLNYNRGRIVSQSAPVWNLLLSDANTGQIGADGSAASPGGQVVPAILSELETRVQATLDARYQEQDGIIVTVYDLDFHGEYHLVYPGPVPTTTIELYFPFPSNLETLHDVRFLVNGEPAEIPLSEQADKLVWTGRLAPGESATFPTLCRKRPSEANT